MHCNMCREHHSVSVSEAVGHLCAFIANNKPFIMSWNLASFGQFHMRLIRAPHAVWISVSILFFFSVCTFVCECHTVTANASLQIIIQLSVNDSPPWLDFACNLVTARYFSYGSVRRARHKHILCWLIFVSCPFFFGSYTRTHLNSFAHSSCLDSFSRILTKAAAERPSNIRVCYLIFQQTMSAFVTKHLIYFVDFVFCFINRR